MVRCPTCGISLGEESRYCGHCGSRLRSLQGAAGAASEDDPQRTEATGLGPSSGASRPSFDSSIDNARFLPGTVLDERYRIVGLLGKGGMGEVYRAHDLKLGREVALKFLPEAYEQDPARLQRFLGEARLSLEVTHANVCRVHDIGEVDGRHFISMEYVDGDDLASLLRRVGRFPEDKAVEVARQLCAGLAAAHDQGVLHRDLKPANVLVDGRGQVKITDFGLAAPVEGRGGTPGRAGTPAYMAPEQWSSGQASVQSDLYALGLVLYELFTGRAAFRGNTPADFATQHRESPPASPASVVEGLDPAVERVILRCLEKSPEDRPRSARVVAAALPGGDPLAAALAAGETPSPELVARGATTGGLRASSAVLLFAAILAGTGAVVRLGADVQLPCSVPLPKPPAVLEERCREIVREYGPPEPVADEVAVLEPNKSLLQRLGHSPPEPGGWKRVRVPEPPALVYSYRSHVSFLQRYNMGAIGNWMSDPPLEQPGMCRVSVDPLARLRELEVVPPARLDSAPIEAATAWEPLLVAAGFDPDSLTPAAPVHTPPFYADEHTAWVGRYAQSPAIPVRIEAAALHGRPVAFHVLDAGDEPGVAKERQASIGKRLSETLGTAVFLLTILGATFVAHRNVRLGRGDRRGALRFALYLGAVRFLWYVGAHHVPSDAELNVLISHAAWSMYRVGLVWVFYLAIEPYARRMWPHMLVSWVRALNGHFRDPLLGRDVLLGLCAGVFVALVARLQQWWPAAHGSAPPAYAFSEWTIEGLRGTRHALTALAGIHTNETVSMLTAIATFLVVRLVLRRTWAAVLLLTGIGLVQAAPAEGGRALAIVSQLIIFALYWVGFFRVGLLALIIAPTVSQFLLQMPLSLRFSPWHAAATWLTLLVLVGMAVHALRTSVTGRAVPGGRGR